MDFDIYNAQGKNQNQNPHISVHGFFANLLLDPSKTCFYIPFIIGIIIILFIFFMIALCYKKKSYEYISGANKELKKTKKLLYFNYLLGFVLARSGMWAKVPYLFILFKTVNKFTIEEIYFLYLIEAVSALIFGPILGFLADKYGRKLFCLLYNFIIILNVLLGILGFRILIYLSQVLAGFGSGLIYTAFEAWIVSESEKEFKNIEKDILFRKRLFRKSYLLEAAANIVISGICAIVYSYLGIYSPFWISILLNLFSSISIGMYWEENKPLSECNQSTSIQIKEVLHEITDVKVLLIGLIEGITFCTFNIFLFSWTSILKQSTEGEIKVVLIFIFMILTMIFGIKLYEICFTYFHCDYYISITACLFGQGILLYITYIDDRFLSRLIYLSLFIGFYGFYSPLNSLVKSNILIDKYRALLMNLYRIPFNIYTILILFTIRYMNPSIIALLAGSLAFVGFLIGMFLCIYIEYQENSEEIKEEVKVK